MSKQDNNSKNTTKMKTINIELTNESMTDVISPSEKYGEKLYCDFIRLGFSGKAYDINEISTHVNYDCLSKELKNLINELPVIVIDETWDHGFFSYKLNGTQQFYVAKHKDTGANLLIDTQGYDYARYVSYIWNLPQGETE